MIQIALWLASACFIAFVLYVLVMAFATQIGRERRQARARRRV